MDSLSNESSQRRWSTFPQPESERLVADHVTLRDLGLGMYGGGDGQLFDLLDHTVSLGGRRRLRIMITDAPLDSTEVRRRQLEVRHLVGIGFSWPGDLGALVDATHRYLSSSYLLLPRSRFSLWRLNRAMPEMMRELRNGVLAVRTLARICLVINESLGAIPVGAAVLARIRSSLSELAQCQEVYGLLRYSSRARSDETGAVQFDADMRGPGRTYVTHALNALEELDALQSMARASTLPGFAFPTISDDGPAFQVEGAFHPLVTNAVPNSLMLDRGAPLVFVTGPNMGGKTTFLRACAIVAVLAMAGMAVPARSAQLSVVDAIVSSVGVQDSVTSGESLFLAEVRRVKAVLAHLKARKRVLVILDEMFKGTNVNDAIDATQAVVSGFAEYRLGFFLVASHLSQLSEALATNSRVALRSFNARNEKAPFGFDYLLCGGASSQRLGMAILEHEGILSDVRSIVAEAANGGFVPSALSSAARSNPA